MRNVFNFFIVSSIDFYKYYSFNLLDMQEHNRLVVHISRSMSTNHSLSQSLSVGCSEDRQKVPTEGISGVPKNTLQLVNCDEEIKTQVKGKEYSHWQ